jgi:hypothetical protein
MTTFSEDSREEAENRGEHVGYCNVHHVKVVDEDCPQCNDDFEYHSNVPDLTEGEE